MNKQESSGDFFHFLLSHNAYLIYIGVFVYISAFNGQLVWDDYSIFQNIETLKNQGFFKLFEGNIFNSLGYYRPIGALYFSFMMNIFGSTPFPYHLVQISLHIVNAALVYTLFKKLIGNNNLSFFLAIIFLIHPINVESVVYISSTVNVLSFLFGITALHLALKTKVSIVHTFLISFLLLLSVLSKESGLIFIIIILCYMVLFRRKSILKFTAVGLSAGGIYGLMHLLVTEVRYSTTFYVPITQLSFSERLIHIPKILFHYLTTFLYPQNLAINQLWIITNITFDNFYLPLLVLLIITIAVIIQIKYLYKVDSKEGLLYVFFFIWLVLGLSPYIQLVPLQNTVADKWFYFPIVGLLGMIGLTLKNLPKKFVPRKEIVLGLAAIIILLLCVRTIVRNNDWQNELTLLKHDIKIEDNYQMESNLAGIYYELKSYQLAEYHLKRSVELYPNAALSWYKLGMLYAVTGDRNSAEEYLRKAILLDKNFDLPYFSLAMIAYEHDGPKKALPLVEDLIKRFPEKQLYHEFHDQIKQDLNNSGVK